MAINDIEQKLWQAADKMRNNMDPAEYKHIILGLIFLKYISDKFEAKYQELVEEGEGFEEDREEYTSENIFWVPEIARFKNIKENAKRSEIEFGSGKKGNVGNLLDEALEHIEKENPQLRGVLAKNYGKPDLDKGRLGEIIDLIAEIEVTNRAGEDVLGQVYEYFLGRFASAEGKGGGEFYTPSSIVKTLVEMIEPHKGRVYDPCCGSGGMFVQSEKFVENHQGRINDISLWGQESNPTTWKLCKMNLAIRGLEGNLGSFHADTFFSDQHKSLRADFILANPPFNISDWGGDKLTDDSRWQFGIPPVGNANYAWLSHIIYHLSATGMAGVVLANGALSSNTSSEGAIRKAMIEEDRVDAIVAMPDKLFLNTGIPCSLWILSRDKANPKHRSRKGEILFIDARSLGEMENRNHRILSNNDIEKIASTYHAYRNSGGEYVDIQGFCKKATLDEVRSHDYILTPGRYVGIEEAEDDGVSFDEKMTTLTQELSEMFKESHHLEERIRENLKSLGYGV